MVELEETLAALDQIEQVVMEDLVEEELVMILPEVLMVMVVVVVVTLEEEEATGMVLNPETEGEEDHIIQALINQMYLISMRVMAK